MPIGHSQAPPSSLRFSGIHLPPDHLQEAVDGYHDTANAVATEIYSNALKALPAVAMAAVMNFLGVLLGGTAVAFGLVYMLPTPMIAGIDGVESIALFLALIVSAVSWNFGTWWLGIPNSTTHTYIGSIIGVSMAYALSTGRPVIEEINWHQGRSILITLAVSPIVGFHPGLRDVETDSTVREGSGDVPPRDPSQASPRSGTPGIATRRRQRCPAPPPGSRRRPRHSARLRGRWNTGAVSGDLRRPCG